MEEDLIQQFKNSIDELIECEPDNKCFCQIMEHTENILDQIQKLYGEQCYNWFNFAYMSVLVAKGDYECH